MGIRNCFAVPVWILLSVVILATLSFGADGTTTTHSRPYLVAARIGVGYDCQPGFGYDLDAGAGLDLDVIVPVSRVFAVQLMYSKAGMQAPDFVAYPDTAYTTYASDASYSGTRYTVGLRYTPKGTLFGIKRMSYHFYLTGGDISQRYEARLLVRRNSTGQSYPYGYDYHPISDWVMTLGIGAQYKIRPTVALDVDWSRYVVIEKCRIERTNETSLVMSQTFTLRAGIVIMWPWGK